MIRAGVVPMAPCMVAPLWHMAPSGLEVPALQDSVPAVLIPPSNLLFEHRLHLHPSSTKRPFGLLVMFNHFSVEELPSSPTVSNLAALKVISYLSHLSVYSI
jgi:hypothetical protein